LKGVIRLSADLILSNAVVMWSKLKDKLEKSKNMFVKMKIEQKAKIEFRIHASI